MENAKQKAIRLAWEEIIGKVNFRKLYIDENGYSKSNCLLFISVKKNELLDSILNLPKGLPKKYQPNGSDFIYRPKSLQGIENNNGWIRIESENDLPSENIDCWFITKKENTYLGECEWHEGELFFVKGVEGFSSDFITHYQPIVKPLKPIY